MAAGAPVQSSLSLTNLPGYTGYAGLDGMLNGRQFDAASLSSASVNDGQAVAAKLGNSQQTYSSLTSQDLSQSQSLTVYSQVKSYSPFIVSAHT